MVKKPTPGNAEVNFHDERPAGKPGNGEPKAGDHRNHRVSQDVTPTHDGFRQSLRTGGSDVVLAQYVQHAGAHQPHHYCDAGHAHHRCRQDDLGRKETVPPAGGQQVQVQREHQEQDRRGDEYGQRLERQCDGHHHVVHSCALAQCREKPYGYADPQGDDDCRQVELQGNRDALGEQLSHGLPAELKALAEVQSSNNPLDIAHVLHDQRIVQTQLSPQPLAYLVVLVLAQPDLDRVTGADSEQSERHEGDDDQQEWQPYQPSRRVCSHL